MKTLVKSIVSALRVRVAGLRNLRQAEQQIYQKALQEQQAKRKTKIIKEPQEPVLSEQEQLTHTAG